MNTIKSKLKVGHLKIIHLALKTSNIVSIPSKNTKIFKKKSLQLKVQLFTIYAYRHTMQCDIQWPINALNQLFISFLYSGGNGNNQPENPVLSFNVEITPPQQCSNSVVMPPDGATCLPDVVPKINQRLLKHRYTKREKLSIFGKQPQMWSAWQKDHTLSDFT